MELESARCYEALKARDTRFDGAFFVGVSTTGIYCRPVCSARTPRHDRCRFFSHPAAAEGAGFRPCLRCRPELAPGAAPAVAPVDAVRSAARWTAARIDAGALNLADFEQLSREYGLSARQLRRAVEREYGVSPVQLAQTRRLLLAKHLLTDSALPMTQVAQASGFGSLRRFNHLFKTRYGLAPGALRRNQGVAAESDAITLRLAYRPPLHWPHLLGFLAGRAAAGVEAAEGARYWRTVQLGGCTGWFSAEPQAGQNALALRIAPALMPVLTPLLARIRQLFDLDANPAVIEAHLAADRRLRAGVRRHSGLRVPGAFDGFEVALRAILGQQVTVKAATTIFGRFAQAYGEAAQGKDATPCAALRWYSPQPQAIANAPLQQIIKLGLPGKRAETVQKLALACASGALVLTPEGDAEQTRSQLQEIPGIGPWTAHYISMRALRDPDAWPHSDLALMKAMGGKKPREMLHAADAWRPWRSYAALHLWTNLNSGGA